MAAYVKALFRAEMATVRTNTVCQVISYDGATNLVSLQPCVKALTPHDIDNPSKALPPLNDIPVYQHGSGQVLCTVAPATGSYGLYVVSDRNVDNWITLGGVVDSGSRDNFNLSSGFFLPGLYPTVTDGNNGKLAGAVQTDRVSLRTRDGASEVSVLTDGTVEINSSSVTINSDADALALASKVDAELTKLINLLSGLGVTPWVPLALDGGLALQTAAKVVFTAPYTVATESAKAKIDA
jgi:hypothetical protein